MASVHTLITACQAAPEALAEQAQQRLSLWDYWLRPVQADNPTGADPGYDDDFQLMREEVNKLSGADADLICTLAEKLLTTTTKIFVSPRITPGRDCTGRVKRDWQTDWICWRV